MGIITRGSSVKYRRPMEGEGILDGDVGFVRWDGVEDIYKQEGRERRERGKEINKLSISILEESLEATKEPSFSSFPLLLPPSPPLLSISWFRT